MLELPNPIGDEKADRIVGSFVNNRLVALMEEAIIDCAVTSGDIADGDYLTAEELDLGRLMMSERFAYEVLLRYLPDWYPKSRANQMFFGLYRLLKAKGAYVPELAMEYVLYHLLEERIWVADMIGSGAWNDEAYGDMELPFKRKYGSEAPATVERIPKSDREIVKSFAREIFKIEYNTDEELEEAAEWLVNQYEDLNEYIDVCFWDTDFEFLDEMTEDELMDSDINKEMGIIAKRELNTMEFGMDRDGTMVSVKAEIKGFPWDLEEA